MHLIYVITVLLLFVPGISGGAPLCAYQGSDITSQNLGLKIWEVTGPQPVSTGDTLAFRYTLVAENPVTLGPKGIFIAGRDPNGKSLTIGSDYQGKALSAGQVVTITSSYTLNQEGTWTFWPSYEVAVITPGMKMGGGYVVGPSLWHSCSISVKSQAPQCKQGCTCLPVNTGMKMGYPYCGGAQTVCGKDLKGTLLYCFEERQVQACRAGCSCLALGDVTGRPGYTACGEQQIPCAYDQQNNPMFCYSQSVTPAPTQSCPSSCSCMAPVGAPSSVYQLCGGTQVVCRYDQQNNPIYCYQSVKTPVPVTSPQVVPTTAATTCPSDCECLTIYEAKEFGYHEYCGEERKQCGEDAEHHPRWCYKVPECRSGCRCLQPDKANTQGLHLCDGKMTGCGFDENNHPRFCYEAPSEQDSDQDGIPDMVENELLERFSPYYKFTKTEFKTFQNDAFQNDIITKKEKYLPLDAIWLIQHSELKNEADEQDENVIGNARLKADPGELLTATGFLFGENTRLGVSSDPHGFHGLENITPVPDASDITHYPGKTYFALNIIGDDARKGHLPGDPFPEGMSVEDMWEEISAKGNVGVYGHVVPYGRFYKVEYYQLFGYSDTEQYTGKGEYGDHEADWSIIQVIYDPETDTLQRVLHHAHGKEMSFDMRLAEDYGEYFDDGAVKQYRGPNYDTGSIDIAKNEGYTHYFCFKVPAGDRDRKGRWEAQNNLIRLYKSSSDSSARTSYLPQTEYFHPVVYIERGAHEFWPSEHWEFIEWVGGCEYYPPPHNGEYVSYLTHDIPNLGEVEYPSDDNAAIIMRYNGRWGAYASYKADPPPGPVIHREWFWPVDSALRKKAYDDTFEDGSSISHHWPAVVDLLITFGIQKWDGLTVGNVMNSSDDIDEIIFADRDEKKIKIMNPIGQFIEEYSIKFEEGDAITAGDIDDDGIDEIIIIGKGNSKNLIIYKNGLETERFTIPDIKFKDFDRLACGNIIGEQDEEIIHGSLNTEEIIVYDDGGIILSRFSPRNGFQGGDGLTSGNTDGIDGDEIVHGDVEGKTISIYSFNGDQVAIFDVVEGKYGKHDGLASGDIDGDGKDEIIHACRATNRITVYSRNGDVLARFFYEFADGEEIATGKFRIGNKEEMVVTNYENNLKIFSLFNRHPGDVSNLSTWGINRKINAPSISLSLFGRYFPLYFSLFVIPIALHLKFRKKYHK